MLRLRSQTKTCGHGHSEAHAAVQHMFDVLYVYKHLIEEGIVKYPKLSCCHRTIGPSVNIVQCFYLQVVRQVSCLEYALYIYLLVIMSDLYTYAC